MRREAQAAQEAADARQREADRQARLEQGRQSIEGAFNGFNDDFYGGIAQRQNDYYMPQLTDQYHKARRTLIANLSRSGNLFSSAGLRQKAELDGKLAEQQAAQNERSRAAANEVRSNVERSRAELNSQLLASADPGNVASVGQSATSRATLLANPEPLSPLADIFGGLVAQGANYLKAAPYREGSGVTIYGARKGTGASYVP